jgi:hypothetical protein
MPRNRKRQVIKDNNNRSPNNSNNSNRQANKLSQLQLQPPRRVPALRSKKMPKTEVRSSGVRVVIKALKRNSFL